MPKTAKAKIWPLRTLGVKVGVAEQLMLQLGADTLLRGLHVRVLL
jgi:hypothetical protein